MTIRKIFPFLVILSFYLILPNQVFADYYKGVEAYKAGDFEAARREWLIDANQGDAKAQYRVGVIYGLGRGVPVDYPMAAHWYRLSADQGHFGAQYNLGTFYENGYGVEKNYQEAMRWYNLAAEQGLWDAHFRLSIMYVGGKGVSRNYVTGYMHLFIAAENNFKDTKQALKILAAEMTPSEISEGNRLAQVWLEEHP